MGVVMSGLHYMGVGEKWVWISLVYENMVVWGKCGCGYVWFILYMGVGEKWV